MKGSKGKVIIIAIISVCILLVMFCVSLFIMQVINNKPIILDYSKNKNINVVFKMDTSKEFSKKIVINGSDEHLDLILKNVDFHKYSDYIVYQLFEDEQLIKKGILHDDIDTKLTSVNNKSTYKLVLDTVNRKEGSINIDFNLALSDSNNENKSISYIKEEYSFDKRIKQLANGKEIKSFESDKNIKSIKIAKTMNEKYLKDEFIVSTKDSSKPIYMWYEDGVLYFYCENTIGLPENSNGIFSNLENLTDIDDLRYFDVSNVKDISYIFSNDKNLNSIKALSYWDTSRLARMDAMFSNCEMLTDISALAAFDTSKVESMYSLFSRSGIKSLNSLRFFDTSYLKSIDSIFSGTEINDLSALENWNVEKIINISSAFSATNIKSLKPLSNWKFNQLEKISFAFDESDIVSLDGLEKWDVSNVKEMTYTFSACLKLEDISALSKWNTEMLESLNHTFQYTSIKNVDALKNWKTHNLVNMKGTFYSARYLNNIDGLENFDVSNVTDFTELFALTSFTDTSPLKNWNTSKVTKMTDTFNHSKIKNVSGIEKWNINNVNNFDGIFGAAPKKPKWDGNYKEDGTFVKN